jgi:hypothetical protein
MDKEEHERPRDVKEYFPYIAVSVTVTEFFPVPPDGCDQAR